ncbi:MAG: ASKHA domain-containing protein [Spirochaetaceae bacterium]|nr:ASKHA domain-containing protein [Spirochaetaceae bacterium]
MEKSKYKINFNVEGGDPVAVTGGAGESVLELARRAGVVIDAPCGGNGTCGKCKIRLLSGGVSGEKSSHIVDADDAEGWRLACSIKPASDIELFLPASAQAFQSRIRVTDFSGAREAAAFGGFRSALEGLGFSGDHGIEKISVSLAAPSLEEATADRERVEKALVEKTGAGRVVFSLFALRRLPASLRDGDFAVVCVVRREEIDGGLYVLDVRPAGGECPLYGIAIDIGTTTVSMLLVNLETGEPVSAASGGNAQIRYGADVINRIIESTKAGGLERLRNAVVHECLAPLVRRLCLSAGAETEQIYRAAIAGNTTMTHLVTGVQGEFIRLEPYVPAFFKTDPLTALCLELPLNPDARVLLAPSVGSYVGGDITAGVFSSMIYDKDTLSLFIDLGTNGELVFGGKEFLMSCACSAGPAFEGGEISCGMRATNGAIEACTIDKDTMEPKLRVIGDDGEKPAGLCGSGLIDMIGELFRCGIINAKGKFNAEGKRIVKDDYGGAGYVVAFAAESASGSDIVLSESDIDNFIRAKGAIFSAIRTMLAIVDMPQEAIDDVYVAGGIGSGIDIEHAILIGMLPNLPLEKFHYIGNTALSGAYGMLVSGRAAQQVEACAGAMTYLELSSHPSYMDEFVAACFLPHTDANLFAPL